MKTKDELITLLVENVEEFNNYVEENNNGIDLTEVDLSNITVADAVFHNIDLSSTTFSDSHFTNVKFENCDLSSTIKILAKSSMSFLKQYFLLKPLLRLVICHQLLIFEEYLQHALLLY